jgi:predicted outer membrane repeat protein
MRKAFTVVTSFGGLALSLFLICLGVPPRAWAGGIVGNGTPSGCTDAALDAALAGGGAVIFNCGPSPFTLSVRQSKEIAADTFIDGGGLVTLDAAGGFALTVDPYVDLTLANLAINNSAGAVMANAGGKLTVSNCTFANNVGLGAIRGTGQVTVSNCTFVDNSTGLHNDGSALTVTDSTFSNNAIAIDDGGRRLNGRLTVSNCIFANNTDFAIHDAGGKLTVTSSTFSNNSGSNGAAISQSGRGSIAVTGSMFSHNGPGGSIATERNITVTNSTFSDNHNATGYGGAIDCSVGKLSVNGSTFSNNSADSGGAIYAGGRLIVSNSTFFGNTSERVGGAIYNGGGKLDMTNNTFTSNAAGTGGGVIYQNLGKLTLKNTILANSTASENCGGTGSIVDRGHNLDSGASCGLRSAKDSLSDTDPRLDPAGPADNGGPTQTIKVQADSPAINAGNQGACNATPIKNRDQRGFARPGAGSTSCTIGAYEFNSTGPFAR